jgi:hypothetical protein
LGRWFEAELATSVEVNEAGNHALIEQAEPIARAVHETFPQEKNDVADAMRDGLQAYCGTTGQTAEP